MSEVTPGPWEADTDREHHIVIHSPTYHNSIVVRDGAYLSIADAALIVKAVNSHDSLVEACATFERWLRREEVGLPLPEGCERDSVEGERLFRAWWDENLRLCGEAQALARAALEEAKP